MTVAIFPSLRGIAWPVAWQPLWNSQVQEAISGKQYVVQFWTFPRRKISVPINVLHSDSYLDWQAMEAFFNQVQGRTLPFLWNQPTDNSIANQPIGTGDGTTTAFAFVRALGGFVEPTQGIQSITQVKVAGTPTSAYTLLTDPNFGLTYGITFTSPPASGAAIVASFTYYWPCRFDKDTAELEQFQLNYWRLKKIEFTTAKII